MAFKDYLKEFVDLSIAIVAIPLAVWLFVIAPNEAPGLYEDGIQPWLYPRIVLAVFIFFCTLMAFIAVKGRSQSGNAPGATLQQERSASMTREAFLNAIVPAGLTILYVVGTIWIGYIYTTAIIAGLYMRYLGATLLGALVVAIGITVVIYFVFGDLLNIPLPHGRLFE